MHDLGPDAVAAYNRWRDALAAMRSGTGTRAAALAAHDRLADALRAPDRARIARNVRQLRERRRDLRNVPGRPKREQFDNQREYDRQYHSWYEIHVRQRR